MWDLGGLEKSSTHSEENQRGRRTVNLRPPHCLGGGPTPRGASSVVGLPSAPKLRRARPWPHCPHTAPHQVPVIFRRLRGLITRPPWGSQVLAGSRPPGARHPPCTQPPSQRGGMTLQASSSEVLPPGLIRRFYPRVSCTVSLLGKHQLLDHL